MTAPATDLSRTDPTSVGIALQDGFATQIAFAIDPDIEFWERSVTPPEYDGGDPIETATMFNSAFRTKAPRKLISVGDVSIVAVYDPVLYEQGKAIINVETTVNVIFPDGSVLGFFGYLRSFAPQGHEEGVLEKRTAGPAQEPGARARRRARRSTRASAQTTGVGRR